VDDLTMQKNFKLCIEYDGTDYHGWQRQKNDRTIQAEIEKAIFAMTRQNLALIAAGRTDAGVHALGQTANFKCITRLTAAQLQKGLNSLLPDDIVIQALSPADDSFHARYDVKSKIYRYRIINRPLPSAIERRYAWFIRRPLNVQAMQAATTHLPGVHDFKAFEGSGSPRSHTVREIFAARLESDPQGLLTFSIQADGFLRFMVRNIVGTLVEVGLEKISPADFRRILEFRDRKQAGATAPPQGLFLVEVFY
jgi:tRNA pseudouridine38-40 synthase